jgi:hypothetical protein
LENLFFGVGLIAADGRLVAAELGEGIDSTAVVIECSAKLAGGFKVFLAGIWGRFVGLGFADGLRAGRKEAGFDRLETVQAPWGDGHSTDQVFRVGADGLMFDVERGEKLMKGVRMLFGQEEGPGGGEAFRSRGAVGTATVFPVGADLFERRHGGGLPPIAA